MKKQMLFTALIITSSLFFTACNKNNGGKISETEGAKESTAVECTTEEHTTEERITEEYTTEDDITEEPETEESAPEETDKLIEYTNNEDNIPKDMTDIAKNSTEYDIGAYLYGDIDNDTEKELLAAYLDMSAGQWKIIKLENDSAEAEEFVSIPLCADYDRCSLGLIDIKDRVQYVVNLSMSMGTDTMGYIFEDDEAGVREVLSLFKTIWQAENGEVIIQNTSYGSCLDKTTGIMAGRTSTYSYMTYDSESGQYKEYVADEITEEDFLAYDGASDVEQSVSDIYGDREIKMTFYRRNNGIMYIQCEYEDDAFIFYEYYTVYYDGNKITGMTEMQQGIIERNLTLLEGC